MEIKDMLSTGAMLIIGVIALKAFGGVQGITKMIGGIGDLLGTGTAAAAAPGVGIIAPETAAQIDIISDMTLPEVALVAETQQIESMYDVLQTASIIAGPIGYIAAPFILGPLEEAAKAETIKTYVQRRAALPVYTPTPLPIYQPSPYVPPDPGHPATDPFLGGR